MRQVFGWMAVVVLCCAARAVAGEEPPDARLLEAQAAYDEAVKLQNAGKYAEALAELRTARRLSGRQDYIPMMADCERALGRPEKALAYDTPAAREALDKAGSVELSIVVAGARRDLGQFPAALRILESEPLHSASREDWVARLRYAYADTLLAAERTEDAIEWFHRTIAVDANEVTDAQDRIAALD